MPARNRSRDFVLEKERVQSLEAWWETVGKLSPRERGALLKFGEKYGGLAMQRQAEGWIADKGGSGVRRVGRGREGLQILAGLRQLWRVGGRRRRQKRADESRRREFVRGFARVAEPLVRTMTTLSFLRLVEKNLTEEELATWEKKVSEKGGWDGRDRAWVVRKLEARSGASLKDLVGQVKGEVEDDLVRMWIENWEEVVTLAKNKAKATRLSEAYESGELEKLARELMGVGGKNG